MTVWARKSLFQETFGSKWNVTINEFEDYVIFSMKPENTATIKIDSYKFTNIKRNITSVGADEAKFCFGKDSGVTVKVSREKLPDDYDNEI